MNKFKKGGIQKRLFKTFTLVTILSLLVLESIILIGFARFSYKNLESSISKKSEYAINTLVYKTDSLNLQDVLGPSFRQYFKDKSAQVQIIDKDFNVIFDSIGVLYSDPILYPDIAQSLNEDKGVWVGKVDYTDERIMAISTPILNSMNQNIGILRMIISLADLDSAIFRVASFIVLIGALVIAFSVVISLYFSKTITDPLKQLSEVAIKIADGQFKVRSDVSTGDEIETLSDSINYMAKELGERDKIKNEFISSVSHELRTPLTSIKGWAITLQNLDEDNRELFNDGMEIIVKESDRLSEMVEELLDFSRLVNGKISLEKYEFDVLEFLTGIVTQMNPFIVKKGYIFSLDFSDNLGMMIADENRLKQVFINLLDNAIKFTELPGAISIFARRRADNFMVISVRDTGIGMSDYETKKVKEKFYKGKNPKSHVGLGLSISNEIVELHGGELKIESKEGKGTTVTVIIPCGVDGEKTL